MTVSREEAKALWEKVQANGRALDACAGPHVFVDVTPEKRIGKRYRCATCCGEVDGVARSWYEQGLAHGRK